MSDPLPGMLDELAAPPDDGELGWLWRARGRGIAVAPMVVVPSATEASFYRLNNLPERLGALFRAVDITDPDEDDIEELAPEAAALVGTHALLDEVIEAFYGALAALPDEVVVRRSGEPGTVTPRGRPALLALKRVWAEDWSAVALAGRLARGGGLAPAPRPVAVHGPGRPALRADAPDLDDVEHAWTRPDGALVRVTVRHR